MAVHINSCVCCSLLTGCIFSSLVSMFLYLLAFALELWWIVEARVELPFPAYLLTLIYFFLSLVSVLTLIGLRTKKTRLLLTWIIFFLLCLFPEAGIVLYMSVYHWHGGLFGVIELTFWVIRALHNIIGTICLHSLYSYWKEEKSVLKSLHELNATNGGFHPNGIAGEYQQKKAWYQDKGLLNNGFVDGSFPHTLAKSTLEREKALSRSSSIASALGSSSRLSVNEVDGQLSHLHASGQFSTLQKKKSHHNNGFSENEFDTAKFSTLNMFANPGLSRSMSYVGSQPDLLLPNFGLDLDAPVFLPPNSYGQGGLEVGGWPAGGPVRGRGAKGRKLPSGLQWYRPRSLLNLGKDADDDAVWEGFDALARDFTNSLDRRKVNLLLSRQRAQSLGALNFGYISEDEALIRSQVGPSLTKVTNSGRMVGDSKLSLGQMSDHADKYRDVAL